MPARRDRQGPGCARQGQTSDPEIWARDQESNWESSLRWERNSRLHLPDVGGLVGLLTTDFFQFLLIGDSAGQPLELLAIEYRVVNHADHQLFRGAPTKTVDNVFDGANGNILPILGRAKNESAPCSGMCDVTLLFQAPQHGADRGFLHGPCRGKGFAAGFSRARAMSPNVFEHGLFDFAEVSRSRDLDASHCSVTRCNSTPRASSSEKFGCP